MVASTQCWNIGRECLITPPPSLRLQSAALLGRFTPSARGAASGAPAAATVISWWYSHLMAATLVDCTAAAIHHVAWVPSRCNAQLLPGWPRVDLLRYAPGHAWVLAATISRGVLTGYLQAVPLAETLRSDVEQLAMRRDQLGRGLLCFRELGDDFRGFGGL